MCYAVQNKILNVWSSIFRKAPCGQKNEDTIAVVRIPCGDIFLQWTMGMEEFRRHDV
jgi:hypothetical protein